MVAATMLIQQVGAVATIASDALRAKASWLAPGGLHS